MRKSGTSCLLASLGTARSSYGRLYFSPTVTFKLEKEGVSSVKTAPVFVPARRPFYPFSLRVEWARREQGPKEGWRKFQTDRDRRTIVFVSPKILGISPEILKEILSLPLDIRRGTLAWISPQEMMLRFGYDNSFYAPELKNLTHPQKKQKKKFLGPCSLRFKREGVYLLALLIETAKKMQDVCGLILVETVDRGWLFKPERGCIISCPSCIYPACHPLRFTRRGEVERYIRITELARCLTLKPGRGEVWKTGAGLLLIEFPEKET